MANRFVSLIWAWPYRANRPKKNCISGRCVLSTFVLRVRWRSAVDKNISGNSGVIYNFGYKLHTSSLINTRRPDFRVGLACTPLHGTATPKETQRFCFHSRKPPTRPPSLSFIYTESARVDFHSSPSCCVRENQLLVNISLFRLVQINMDSVKGVN